MVAASLIFSYPAFLAIIPFLAIGGYYFWRYARNQAARKLRLFVSAGTLLDHTETLNNWVRKVRFALPLAMLILLTFALARPLFGPKPDNAERRGADFVVALDVSKSMWAEDLSPNRLDAVKSELSEWMKTQAGDRMGLILFAGDAVIQAPITADFQALTRVLQGASPRILSKGGTNIPDAIEMAKTLLDKSDIDTRTLVIISDGENLSGDAATAAQEAHSKDGLTIFTIGVGSDAGAKVPEADYLDFAKNPKNKRPYIRNEYGSEVVSRRDEAALQRIAAAGGGRYVPFTPGHQFFAKFRDEALLPLAKSRTILNTHDYYELFQIPLFLAILLLMAEPFLPKTRPRRIMSRPGVPITSPATQSGPAGAPVKLAAKAAKPLVPTILLLLALSSHAAIADLRTLQQTAEQLLKEKKPDEAIALIQGELRKAPSDPALLYNYGLVLAQSGKLEEAVTTFQEAKLLSSDETLRERALFQLGNAQFHLAQNLKDQSAQVLSLERSLTFYDELLKVHPDSDAIRNRKVAEEDLQQTLRMIVSDRLKSAEESALKSQDVRASRNLLDAIDALERLSSLNPEDQSVKAELQQTRQKLAENLLRQAENQSAKTDRIEALNEKKDDGTVLRLREQTIDLLTQAQAQRPDNDAIQQAILQEKEKAADLMTRRAGEKIVPALAREKPNSGDLDALNKGRKELSNALELDPENAKAKDLKAQAEERLEAVYTKQGEDALANAQKPADARNRLRSAVNAQDSFLRVQAFKPDSERASKGMEQVQEILPQLHAEAAALDLAEAKALLQKGNDQSSPADLKKVVGTLETATQNFNRAISLKPDEKKFQQGFAEAQEMLTNSRDELDKQRQTETTPANQSPRAGAANQPNEPNTKIYSQTPARPTTDPASSESFWNRTKQDW